ncbi:MAG: cyclic nucleotide-binding domain-containing protein [Bacillota bacterium]
MKRLQLNVDLLGQLKDVGLFHYLSDDEKRQLISNCELFEYAKDEKVVTQGEVSSCFFVVFSGTLNVTVKDNTGKEVFISSIGAGDFFGEAGIFTNAQRTANVAPATDSAGILRIDRNAFFDFVKQYPTAGVKMLMLFINGLLKKLSDSNKELAMTRSSVLDQSAIDSFLQNMR